MDRVHLACIGLGGRGTGLTNLVASMDDVHVAAVCDVYPDRVERAIDRIDEAQSYRPEGYANYDDVLRREDLDGVIVATSWTTHVEISLAAMRAGLYVGSEVGGAASIQECWELVRTSEETGMPFMLLENCCYGREEMAVLNMVKKDLFGELIHCQCGYEHDLRSEISRGEENRHYRLNNFVHRNGDLYPTHGLGPIAKMLDINKGNRFISLVAMSSKARGLHQYAVDHLGPEHAQFNTVFNQGDITTTMIKCANGKTVLLTHDCSLPRPYSRAQRVQGTKGIWMEDKNAVHFDSGEGEGYDRLLEVKGTIERLKEQGRYLLKLHEMKRVAVEQEDYEVAKRLKLRIEEFREVDVKGGSMQPQPSPLQHEDMHSMQGLHVSKVDLAEPEMSEVGLGVGSEAPSTQFQD